MKTLKVNNKEYKAAEFDFNMMCDFEDAGISTQEINSKHMSVVRAYFMMCSGLDKVSAGKELQNHIINGGTYEDIVKVMNEQMTNSDFFRALGQRTETEVGEDEKKTAKEK